MSLQNAEPTASKFAEKLRARPKCSASSFKTPGTVEWLKMEIFKVTLSPIKRQTDADALALVAQFFGIDATLFCRCHNYPRHLHHRASQAFQRLIDVIRSFSLFFFLYLFWLLLSGFFTPFLMVSGAGCALAVTWFAQRMKVVDAEGHPIQLGAHALIYWAWLFKEIIKSAWDVSKIIVHPKLPISPTLVRFKPSQKTEVGLVLHANSITLTPGTIAIEAHSQEFLVHGLTRASAQAVVDSEMDRRVTACEGKT